MSQESKVNAVTYSWKDLNVWTNGENAGCCGKKNKSSGRKTILHSVNGIVRPTELLALMGSSGAGKTTLLNMLTFRNSGKLSWSGERCINGAPVNADSLASISAYIQQDDIFIGVLTPREHLRFHATLRMDRHIPHKQRLIRVEEVIQEFGLTACADTIIGIPGVIKGLSGGQKKRLAVASEILTDPPLMFFDEPTTGLDSFMSQSLVMILKNLAARGKTIVCTIHQPSSEVFALFDKILLMSEGRIAFMGDTKGVLPFLATQGYPSPINYNPADFFIHTLAIKPGKEQECLEKAKAICSGFENSSMAKDIKDNIEKISLQQSNGMYSDFLSNTNIGQYKASWLTQFLAVLWRSVITVLKEPALLRIQLMQTVLVALVIGTVFFGQKIDQEGIQNINGAIFLVIIDVVFNNSFAVVNNFWAELPVFMREHHNGMYRVDVYYLAKTFAELPLYILTPFIYTTIVYFMIGLNTSADRYFIACGIFILLANVGTSYGYMISTLSTSLDMALGLVPVCLTPFMIFGGTFLNKESIPVYFVWLEYISWFLYGNEALVINQWKGIDDIECSHNTSCITNGEAVLDQLNFKEENFAVNIIAICGLLATFRIICFLAMLKKTYRPS